MSNVAVINPETRPALTAGGRPSAIIPHSMDEAYRLAKAICMAQMAPKGMDTPEKAMVAIMHGLEIGLTPMVALQRIAVVNGRPTLWGDGAVALVRSSGLCEWIKETIEGEGDNRKAICEAKRKGEPGTILRTFSVSDAKKAGLWGKGGPWQQYPERMLSMRARAFCLRDGFADAMGGMYLKEELDDVPAQAPRAPAPPPPPAPAIEPPKAAEFTEAVQETFPGAEVVHHGSVIIDEFREASEVALTVDDLEEAYSDIVQPAEGSVPVRVMEQCDEIYRKARQRIEKAS